MCPTQLRTTRAVSKYTPMMLLVLQIAPSPQLVRPQGWRQQAAMLCPAQASAATRKLFNCLQSPPESAPASQQQQQRM